MFGLILLISILILFATVIGLGIWSIFSGSGPFQIHIEDPQKKAGRQGEAFATLIIREILRERDTLLTNVRVSVEGKQTELDNVIINPEGIFIIEVKNYSGELVGNEDDHDWIQTKTSYGGSFYQKSVKNPTRQVKRQIYILSAFLKENGIDLWINGYVCLGERNSPGESEYVLRTQKDIDKVIHRGAKRRLSESEICTVVELLQRQEYYNENKAGGWDL